MIKIKFRCEKCNKEFETDIKKRYKCNDCKQFMVEVKPNQKIIGKRCKHCRKIFIKESEVYDEEDGIIRFLCPFCNCPQSQTETKKTWHRDPWGRKVDNRTGQLLSLKDGIKD